MNLVNGWFSDKISKMEGYSVLEIGTRRWGDNPTHHKDWFPNHGKYVMTDFMEGKDVDVLADAHDLSFVFGEKSFDVVIACSLFEHLSKPWIVAKEIVKTLNHGGVFYIQTHQSFPVHGYPHDYYRYTREGLEVLFEEVSEKISDYEYPAKIISDECGEQKRCYLNVCIAGRKA